MNLGAIAMKGDSILPHSSRTGFSFQDTKINDSHSFICQISLQLLISGQGEKYTSMKCKQSFKN